MKNKLLHTPDGVRDLYNEAYDYYLNKTSVEFVEPDRNVTLSVSNNDYISPLSEDEEEYLSWGPEYIGFDKNRLYITVYIDDEEVEELINCYRNINEKIMPEYIKAFDGIEEVLKELKKSGFKIAIVSNKVTDAVVQGLKICNINQYFDLIIGAEKMDHPKPAPDGIKKALKLLKKKEKI